MAILQINTDYTGQSGILPRTVKILCNDSLATVTSANYLSQAYQQGYTFYPTDIFIVSYQNNAWALFSATIIPPDGITLSLAYQPNAVFISGSVTTGHLPSFGSTADSIVDSGIASANVQLISSVIANHYSWGGGGTTNIFTVPGILTTSIVSVTIATASNAVSIISAKIITNGQLTVQFSADPGAGTTINVIAFIAPQNG
jgi:hypothetical protein